ncbi:RICIN domain-containing protein [Streptomyces longispororuber]|uniref:RICIN domain-containing protein n=1 Tax=Streptomyces longispororuber TaxID=68230 RepID=UPI0033C39494
MHWQTRHQRNRRGAPRHKRSSWRAVAVAVVVDGVLAACLAFTGPAGAADGSARAADITVVALHSGLCVEVGSTASGEAVRQSHCAGKRAALWTLRQSTLGSDLVHVVNSASGLCMTVADSSPADGAPLRQESCGGRPGASFRVVDSGDGAWLQPVTTSPRKCVGVAGASRADRAELAQWACDSGAGIRFQQRRPPAEWRTTVVNTSSGKCLGIRDAGHAEREWALQRTCTGNADETWRIVTLEGDGVAVVNLNSDKCLVSTQDTNGANGSQAKQATCDGYPYQRWYVEERSPGVYALQNLKLRQYVGVRPPVTADGALAEFWERAPDRAQEWRLGGF